MAPTDPLHGRLYSLEYKLAYCYFTNLNSLLHILYRLNSNVWFVTETFFDSSLFFTVLKRKVFS